MALMLPRLFIQKKALLLSLLLFHILQEFQLCYCGEFPLKSTDKAISLMGRMDTAKDREILSHVLVVFPDKTCNEKYSKYLNYLHDYQFKLKFAYNDDYRSTMIRAHGALSVGQIVIFDDTDCAGGVRLPLLMLDAKNFLEDGGNIMLITGGSTVGIASQEIAKICSIKFQSLNKVVMTFAGSSTTKSQLKIPMNIPSPLSREHTSFKTKDNFVHLVDPENPFTISFVRPPINSYLGCDNCSEASEGTGSFASLLSGMQTRNGARVLLMGSFVLFKNEYFSLNSMAVTATEWSFRKLGVLAYANLRHYEIGSENAEKGLYNMGNDVVFEIELYELRRGLWEPYVANDVQLELFFYHPYYRVFLEAQGNDGAYSAKIRMPDEPAVFKFVLYHRRLGYNTLYVESLAPVRSRRHDQSWRFVQRAYPYYVSVFASLFGTLLYCIVFLFHHDKDS